jgi:hypothetical protein
MCRRSLVVPCVHLGKALAKTADRNAELDVTRQPALGLDDHKLRTRRYCPVLFLYIGILPASSWLANGRGCPISERENILNICVLTKAATETALPSRSLIAA